MFTITVDIGLTFLLANHRYLPAIRTEEGW